MAIKESNKIVIVEQKKVIKVIEWYLASDKKEGVTIDDLNWKDNFSDVILDTNNKYLWNYEEVVYSLGANEKSNPVIIGVYESGSGGADGRTSYFHIKYSEYPNPTNDQMTEIPSKYIGTYVDFSSEDSLEAKDYMWSQFRGDDGSNGENGLGIKSSIISYATDVQGSIPPKIGWTENFPTDIEGKFLWTKTVLIYTDGSQSQPSYSVSKEGANGEAGKDGLSVTGAKTTYSKSNQGKIPPENNWTEDIPNLLSGEFLWSRTIFKYSDGTFSNPSYSVSKNGNDGQRGDTSYVHIKYSNDGGLSFTANDGEDAGEYIGQYTDFIKEDSLDPKKYKWALIKGSNGENGVGIKNTEIKYASSLDGINPPKEGWLSYIPDLKENEFLWTRTILTFSDGNISEPSYSVSRNGIDGINGSDGANGTDGKTSYIHIKYSAKSNPEDQDLTEIPSEYIGTYTDFSEADSMFAKDYKWSKFMGDNGQNGVGVSKAIITYAVSDQGISAPESGWENTIPVILEGQYLWTKTILQYTDGKYSDPSYSVSRNGTNGANGANGTNGENGDTSYIHIKYSNDNGQTLTGNNGEDVGLYIGQYTDFIEEDSLDVGKYKWALIKGSDGINGENGTDGIGIKKTLNEYAVSDQSVNPPAVWSPNIPEIKDGQYLWTKTILVYTDETKSDPLYTVNKNGINGVDGSTTYVHIKYSNDGGASFTTNNGEDPGSYIGQYTDFIQDDSLEVKKYTWSLIKGTDGTNGSDGVGVKTTKIQYAVSENGDIPPKDGFVDEFPTILEGQYLWTKIVLEYTDGKFSNPSYSVSRNGIDGKNGSDGTNGENGKTSYIHIKYSAYPNPTNEQITEEPSEYIGQYTDFVEEDSLIATDYKWSKFQGKDGINGNNGIGVQEAIISYGISDSGETQPIEWGPNVPTIPEGQYLWTKTVLKYTNGTLSNPSFSVSRNGFNGKDGANGSNGTNGETSYIHIKYSNDGGNNFTANDGETPGDYIGQYTDFNSIDSKNVKDYTWSLIKGADGSDGTNGVGVKSAKIQYKIDSQGTIPPSAGWVDDFPNVPEGKYLWTKTEIVYTENLSNSISYSVSKNGTNGTNGTNGENGQTSYIHIKYSDYSNPTDEQITEVPSEYIGTYTDFKSEDSIHAKDYKWAKFQGTDGINGNDGVGVKGAEINYAASNDGENPPNTGWDVNIPTDLNGKYLWTRTILIYTDESRSNPSYSVGRNGTDGTNGSNGTDGETSYIHIKYSNDKGATFTSNNGEDVGLYIGQYTDFVEADSNDPKKYKWALIKGSDGISITGIINYYCLTQDPILPPEIKWDTTPGTMTLTLRFLWNYEEVTYSDGKVKKTDPAIIGAYGDSGTDAEAIVFRIYSTDGFQFTDEIKMINLKTSAFRNGEEISGGTYLWEYWDNNSKKYVAINNGTSNSLIVNKTDKILFNSIRCTLTYQNKKYYDSVSITVKEDNYLSLIKFFDGSNIFSQDKPYLIAYIEVYKNNILMDSESVYTTKYYYGDVKFSGDVIISNIDINEIKDGEYVYFVYPESNGKISYTLGIYRLSDKKFHKYSYTNKFKYKNNLYPENNTNIIPISKEDIIKSKELDVLIYDNEKQISICSASVVDTNDPIISKTPPENIKPGQLWLDTSVEPYVLRIYENVKSTSVKKEIDPQFVKFYEDTKPDNLKTIKLSDDIKKENGKMILNNSNEIYVSFEEDQSANLLTSKYFYGLNGNLYFADSSMRYLKMKSSNVYSLGFDQCWKITDIIESSEYRWKKYDAEEGSHIYTSRPYNYKKGDLWILGTGETCGVYKEGTILKAIETSDIFDQSHWTDNISSITELVTNIKESFIWDNTGIKVMRKITDSNGNVKTPFYVKIDSTRMGFHSVDYRNFEKINDVEVVHIGNNSAIIKNATFEGKDGTNFNNPANFNMQLNVNGTNSKFIIKIEENGSLSFAIDNSIDKITETGWNTDASVLNWNDDNNNTTKWNEEKR